MTLNYLFKLTQTGFQNQLKLTLQKIALFTLQFSFMIGALQGRKFILEHSEWAGEYPDHSRYLPSPNWTGETALLAILDRLYNCLGCFKKNRFRTKIEKDLNQKIPLEFHLFYSYSGVVALMGWHLSTFTMRRLEIEFTLN